MPQSSPQNHLPTYAQKDLAMGKCAIGKFRGQTALYIPRQLVDSLGVSIIRQMIEAVFTKPVLDDFCHTEYECPSYLLVELPPIADETDQRIAKLLAQLVA